MKLRGRIIKLKHFILFNICTFQKLICPTEGILSNSAPICAIHFSDPWQAGTSRDKSGTRQGHKGTNRDKQGHSLSVPAFPYLSLSVHACPCLSLSVPVCPCLSLSVHVCLFVPVCPCVSLYVSTFAIPLCLPIFSAADPPA